MSDGIQLYPFSDGSIKPCEGWTAPRGNGLNEVLEKAFGGLAGEGFEYEKTDGTIKTVRTKAS